MALLIFDKNSYRTRHSFEAVDQEPSQDRVFILTDNNRTRSRTTTCIKLHTLMPACMRICLLTRRKQSTTSISYLLHRIPHTAFAPQGTLPRAKPASFICLCYLRVYVIVFLMPLNTNVLLLLPSYDKHARPQTGKQTTD